ncbi:MAG: exo-alpha-sialidase [Acidobacteriota bacterium]|nr:MAG: exo-alpha-sialidase [Acidobacteriota bacterium]
MVNIQILALLLMTVLSPSVPAQVNELESPAGPGSGQPNLTVSSDGRVYLSWIERLEGGRYSLRFSRFENNEWSEPGVISEGTNWFVNWADFPSMVVLPDGTLAAHWLVMSGTSTYDYDVTISRSFDGGKTWEKPFSPHRDGVRAEHGFVSLFAAKDGNLSAVWLDGREMKPGDHGHGNMTLRYVKILRDGSLAGEAALDARVCECCQTSAAMTSDGPVVVYRDRSDDEVRDISIVRLHDGKWSPPQPVFNDGWRINGCPVNGPSIAAADRRVAVAWYTGVDNKPRVKLAFSGDSGLSFDNPVIVDDGNPVGRVETLMLEDGSALVCWLERVAGGGEVRLKRIRPDGKSDPSITVSATGTARSNGFPQMAPAGDRIVFAWTGKKVMTGISRK